MIGTLAAAAVFLGLAGAAHCAGMCGGVVGILCGGIPREKSNVRFILLYNAGRIVSYSLFGAIAGAIGATAASFPLGDARLGLRIFAAIIAVIVGLRLLGLGVVTAWRGPGSPIFRWMRPVAAKLLPVRSAWHALALGALWGWLPCGMVYAAATLALSAESALGGALVMASFGIGTLPAMLALGTLAARLASALSNRWVRRASGVALVVSGVMAASGSICVATQDVRASANEGAFCAGHARGLHFAQEGTP